MTLTDFDLVSTDSRNLSVTFQSTVAVVALTNGQAVLTSSATPTACGASAGADAPTQVVEPVSVSTLSNGEDWHLGVPELHPSGYADSDEQFYFTSVYIESGSLTTSVSGPAS
ncbi:hypothetical protein BD289DRAFT_481757 [Coniella lustricola]|uniref:Uncharacterized protein n=1 Tax=Coniella lustricola TaxID=2025994 RepID=A0A2T3ABA8_9PEZI|nr:hypothetical protein BD289DRAFT_481757 [Coniella lustricola]